MRLPYVGTYPITQRFNDSYCRASYAKFGMNGHNGIDYGTPTGTPILAAHAGTAYVKSDPGGFGNYVEVHTNEYKTIYAHLSKTLVSNGVYVDEGKLIGSSGATGNVTGPHLHFGLKPHNHDKNNGFLGWVDPQPYLDRDNSKGQIMNKEQATQLSLYLRLAAGATVDEANKSSAYDVQHILADPGYAAALAKQIYNANEGYRYKANRYDLVVEEAQKLQQANAALSDANAELQAQLAAAQASASKAQQQLEAQQGTGTGALDEYSLGQLLSAAFAKLFKIK